MREALLLVVRSAQKLQIVSESISEKHDEHRLHMARCGLPDGVGAHSLINSKKPHGTAVSVILQIIQADPGWLKATFLQGCCL